MNQPVTFQVNGTFTPAASSDYVVIVNSGYYSIAFDSDSMSGIGDALAGKKSIEMRHRPYIMQNPV